MNKTEQKIILTRQKDNDRPSRRSTATDTASIRALIGEQALYASIIKGKRVVIFHDVQGLDISSTREEPKINRLKDDPSWGSVTIRKNERVRFALPLKIRTSKNMVRSITVS